MKNHVRYEIILPGIRRDKLALVVRMNVVAHLEDGVVLPLAKLAHIVLDLNSDIPSHFCFLLFRVCFSFCSDTTRFFSPKNLERSWGRSPGLEVRFGDFLIGECEAAHTRLDAQDVVVDSEQLLQGVGDVGLELHRHLGVINAREVAGAGGLVLLGLQSEGVHVDAGVRDAGVVVEGLDLVEVLAELLLEAVLAVEDNLEQVQRTDLVPLGTGIIRVALLDPVAIASSWHNARRSQGHTRSVNNDWHAGGVWYHPVVRCREHQYIAGHVHVCRVGAEVPHGVQLGLG